MDVEAYIAELRASKMRPTDWDKRTESIIRRILTRPLSEFKAPPIGKRRKCRQTKRSPK